MSVQPHIVWKYAGHFVLVLQGRVCCQAIKGRKVWEWYLIIMHWTSSSLFFYISCHFCVVTQCVDTHIKKKLHRRLLSPYLSLHSCSLQRYSFTDQPKPLTLVWNSGKVWTRQCIIQYNYEEPIILIIILYIIYWQRLFHLRFLKFD